MAGTLRQEKMFPNRFIGRARIYILRIGNVPGLESDVTSRIEEADRDRSMPAVAKVALQSDDLGGRLFFPARLSVTLDKESPSRFGQDRPLPNLRLIIAMPGHGIKVNVQDVARESPDLHPPLSRRRKCAQSQNQAGGESQAQASQVDEPSTAKGACQGVFSPAGAGLFSAAWS